MVFTIQADHAGFSSPRAAAQISICVLIPSTELGLSEILMELPQLLRKFSWIPPGTCQTPLLSSVHSKISWLKVTEGKGSGLEAGWWPEPFLSSGLSCWLVAGVVWKAAYEQ